MFKALFNVSNPLFSDAPDLANEVECKILDLRQVTAGQQLGGWRLEISAIEFLWQSLLTRQPKVLLECGSGLSTLILAKYAEMQSKDRCQPTIVLSLDQNPGFLAETEELLKAHGLVRYVRLFEAPIDSRGSYDLSGTSLQTALTANRLEWLLIDGPSGPPGCRLHTLPDLAAHCHDRAAWFLDDAFREAELSILTGWAKHERLVVAGVLSTKKGLATGIVRAFAGATGA